ncbi:MAG TPA: TetR family transcriptional regulator [Jiangellaceae bacterium]
MAWDTEGTKRRLLDAAVDEFAEHGPAGARVDRIAKSAGVNKERIYQYFDDKDGLFQAVLDSELLKLAAANPLTPEAAKDLGAYAGRAFDYHRDHPHYLRLLRWEGLADDPSLAVSEERHAHYREKIEAIAAAQAKGAIPGDLDPGALMYAVIALAAWWFVTPSAALKVGRDVDMADRRAITVELARRLTTP